MNRTPAMGLAMAALIAAVTLPQAALADEEQRKSLREECRSIAEGHGVQAGGLDSWIERCVENTTRIRKAMEEERRVAPNPHGAPEDGQDGH